MNINLSSSPEEDSPISIPHSNPPNQPYPQYPLPLNRPPPQFLHLTPPLQGLTQVPPLARWIRQSLSPCRPCRNIRRGLRHEGSSRHSLVVESSGVEVRRRRRRRVG